MMDPKTKEFEPITDEKATDMAKNGMGSLVFKVGQHVMLNGVEMAVRKITRKDVILRPVK